jgi:hypothetical protein
MLARSEELPWRGVNSAYRRLAYSMSERPLMQKHGVFKLDDIE